MKLSNLVTAHEIFNSNGMAGNKVQKNQASAQTTAKNTSYKVGDIVTIGNYRGEPIRWIVLEIVGSVIGNQILVVSEKAIEKKEYHSDFWASDISWKDSEIRNWLNNDFIDLAFSEAEKQKIGTSTVFNPEYNISSDKIFLMSDSEIKKYFITNEERVCYPSEYLKKNGVRYACSWWTRSDGETDKKHKKVINNVGGIDTTGVEIQAKTICVRPTMRLLASKL